MKQIHRKKPVTNSMIFTIFFTFVVIAVISVFCLITYVQTNDRLKKIAITESEQFLVQSADTMSKSFHSVWKIFTNSSLLFRFNYILSEEWKEGQPVHNTLRTLSCELNNHFYANDYVWDVGLFFTDGETDYWCTTWLLSDDFRADYENGLYSFDDMSYDAYREMILSSPDNRLVRQDFHAGYVTSNYSNAYSCQMLYLIYPVRVNRSSLQAFAVMQINLDLLQDKLTYFQYAGDYFGLYANGQPVYSTDPDVYLSGTYPEKFSGHEDTYYLRTFIDQLGLTCYISLDSEKIYQGITPFSTLLILLFGILILTGSVLICFFFYYWLIPITRTAAALPDCASEKNDILKIKRHLMELSAKNREIQKELFEHQKNTILQDIYLGKTQSGHNTLTVPELAPVGEYNYRCICIGCLNAKETISLNPDSIQDQMEALSIPVVACVILDDLFTGLVIQPDNSVYTDSQAFFIRLNDLLDALNPEGIPQFAIGISDVFNGTDSIPVAWQEARNSWRSALLWQNAAVVFNTSLSQYSSSYFVSYTMLDSLYQAIITNHKDTALEIFDQLVADNFENNKTGRQRVLYCQQFTSDILGVLVRISSEFDIHAIIESYLSMNTLLSLEKRIALLREAVIESCEFIPVHEYDKDLSNAIFEYCEEHYTDYQISLSLLADQFHLSKSSISKYFKANSGVNFSAYIEKLRIQQAEKLLLEERLSVRDIAEKVGYQNVTTFYNAFRKVHRCTPTEWIKQKITRQ